MSVDDLGAPSIQRPDVTRNPYLPSASAETLAQ